MKRAILAFLLGASAASAACAWLAYAEVGDGNSDHGPYRWHRFVLGEHAIEIHVEQR